MLTLKPEKIDPIISLKSLKNPDTLLINENNGSTVILTSALDSVDFSYILNNLGAIKIMSGLKLIKKNNNKNDQEKQYEKLYKEGLAFFGLSIKYYNKDLIAKINKSVIFSVNKKYGNALGILEGIDTAKYEKYPLSCYFYERGTIKYKKLESNLEEQDNKKLEDIYLDLETSLRYNPLINILAYEKLIDVEKILHARGKKKHRKDLKRIINKGIDSYGKIKYSNYVNKLIQFKNSLTPI